MDAGKEGIMEFDKIVIQGFLEKINNISDIIEFSVYKEEENSLMFEAKTKPDLFVSGGLLNYTNEYTLLIDKACKRFFNAKASFNNTGSIFWIYKK